MTNAWKERYRFPPHHAFGYHTRALKNVYGLILQHLFIREGSRCLIMEI